MDIAPGYPPDSRPMRPLHIASDSMLMRSPHIAWACVSNQMSPIPLNPMASYLSPCDWLVVCCSYWTDAVRRAFRDKFHYFKWLKNLHLVSSSLTRKCLNWPNALIAPNFSNLRNFKPPKASLFLLSTMVPRVAVMPLIMVFLLLHRLLHSSRWVGLCYFNSSGYSSSSRSCVYVAKCIRIQLLLK